VGVSKTFTVTNIVNGKELPIYFVERVGDLELEKAKVSC